MVDVGLDAQQNHVIAFNTWTGPGVPPAPPNALGMQYYTIVLPDALELQRAVDRVQATGLTAEQTEEGFVVHDPSHIKILLTDRPPTR